MIMQAHTQTHAHALPHMHVRTLIVFVIIYTIAHCTLDMRDVRVDKLVMRCF